MSGCKGLQKISPPISQHYQLTKISNEDKAALKTLARNAVLKTWRKDPIGSINGVDIVTYQYLRMTGGVDTMMPDTIVKRVINKILMRVNVEPVRNNIEFVKKTKEVVLACGYKPIELCWMTWLKQPEGKKSGQKIFKNSIKNIKIA